MGWVWDAIAKRVKKGTFGGAMAPRVSEVVQATAVRPKKL
jgi:hypothetical protein